MLRRAPIDAFEEVSQLRGADRHRFTRRRWPDEAPTLQPFGKEAHALAVVPDELDQIAPLAAEDKHMARMRIALQHFLYAQRQAVKTLAHVGKAGGKPNPRAGRNRDHQLNAAITRLSSAMSVLWLTISRAPDVRAISSSPSLRIGDETATGMNVFAGSRRGAPRVPVPVRPSALRQRNNSVVETPCFFATRNTPQETANKESNGRFHSDWLSMMYSRLRIAKKLLAQDGFILISIDNHEVHNLKALCSEVFGQENFRNMIVVRRGIKNVQSQFEDISALASGHEYILCYSREASTRLPKLSHISDQNHAGKWDTFWRGTDRPTMRYPLFGRKPDTGQWRWSKDKAKQAQDNYARYLALPADKPSLDDYYLDHLQATNVKTDFVRLNEDDVVQYYVPPRDYKLISDNWIDITIKGNYTDFDTEKHTNLLRRIIDWIASDGDIVLDFFAGSGSTGHAVFESNVARNSHNRFILVQIPQPTPGKEFSTLADLRKGRLRKAAEEVRTQTGMLDADLGFRVLKIDSTNMADVFYAPDALKQGDLLSAVDNIKSGRDHPEDLLFQVLLDWGIDLSLPTRAVSGRVESGFPLDAGRQSLGK